MVSQILSFSGTTTHAPFRKFSRFLIAGYTNIDLLAFLFEAVAMMLDIQDGRLENTWAYQEITEKQRFDSRAVRGVEYSSLKN